MKTEHSVDGLDGNVGPVGVVGLGVVGKTVAAAFREARVRVHGYDRYLGIGDLHDLGSCRVVFVCVPTPTPGEGGHDLAEVWSAVKEVAPHLRLGAVIALKSTVPPGTSDELSRNFPDVQFASVPEFLVATRASESFSHPDRIVIGVRSLEAAETLAALMRRVASIAPVVFVRPTEAELVKLCSNAMLAAKVAMANELANICERFGVPWARVQAIVGLDRRIGPDHLTVTRQRGFGGECLPKDLDGLIAASRGAGHEPALLEEIASFNRMIRARGWTPPSETSSKQGSGTSPQ